MEYQYDVAISYKSEIEKSAARIADYLKADHWKVFFAPLNQQELVAEKLHQRLYSIYKNEAKLKLLLISDHYLANEWTSLEKRVSLESTKEDRSRLVIVNYTGDLLPDDLTELAFLDGTKMKEDEIAAFVTERLQRQQDHIVREEKQEKETQRKEIQRKETQEKSGESKIQVQVNHGIVAGDNAKFGDIHF